MRTTTRTIAALTVALAALLGGSAYAGEGQWDPCAQGGHGNPEQGGDLCAQGQAGCVAIGLYVKVEPNAALPGGATVQLSRSQANAFAFGDPHGGFGMGYGHGDAAQAKADVPPTLGAGAIESRCDAYAQPGYASAYGEADTARLWLSLYTYGIPVILYGDVLHETGGSTNGTGGNSANVVDFGGSAFGSPLPAISNSQPPNTTYALGPVTLHFNEQMVGGFACPVYSGDALRVEITDPVSGALLATVIVSWVSTTACPM